MNVRTVQAGAAAAARNRPAVKPLEEFALRLGDDALILSYRLTEWSRRAPDHADKVALANVVLDLVGQAAALLTLAGRSGDRTEDVLTFERTDEEFHNALITEMPDDDFAHAMARLWLFSVYQCEWYAALAECVDPELAAVAAKARTEAERHRQYAQSWVIRLGEGTAESHDGMTDALIELWPYTSELFAQDELMDQLIAEGLAPDPAPILGRWLEQVTSVLIDATLGPPPSVAWRPAGGRSGVHTEALGRLLAQVRSVRRPGPRAAW